MQQATKRRALRCPCGVRMQASHDGALHDMLRDHIEREHAPYTDAPPEERVKEMVSSAVYSCEYVTLGAQESLEEEGFGPEPF